MSDLRDFNSAGSEPVFETNFARPAHVDYLSERIDLSGEGIEHSSALSSRTRKARAAS